MTRSLSPAGAVAGDDRDPRAGRRCARVPAGVRACAGRGTGRAARDRAVEGRGRAPSTISAAPRRWRGRSSSTTPSGSCASPVDSSSATAALRCPCGSASPGTRASPCRSRQLQARSSGRSSPARCPPASSRSPGTGGGGRAALLPPRATSCACAATGPVGRSDLTAPVDVRVAARHASLASRGARRQHPHADHRGRHRHDRELRPLRRVRADARRRRAARGQ